jgi:GTPase SAR1 family protein
LENIGTKWKAEIEENCPGVKIVLVALKCDLREKQDDDESGEPKRPTIQYQQGLEVAQKVKALRYLGMMTANIGTQTSPLTKLRMLGYEESWGERGIHRGC